MYYVYGIKTCSTVQKALKWLEMHGIDAQLHDFRTTGVTREFLEKAEKQFGWESLINKRSTTWRNLDEMVKENLSKDTALEILLEHPTLIKRPIILQEGKALLGFDEKQYQMAFDL